MKKLLLLILLGSLFGCVAPNTTIITKAGFKQKWAIMTKYDKFEDYTTAKLLFPLYNIKSPSVFDMSTLQMELYFISKGNAIIKPDTIRFGLLSSSKSWKYLKSHNLNLIVDGERIKLGKMDYDGDVGYGSVSENMWISIPLDLFLKLANAKKVEGQLFTTEFILKEKHIEGFRDFAIKMQLQ